MPWLAHDFMSLRRRSAGIPTESLTLVWPPAARRPSRRSAEGGQPRQPGPPCSVTERHSKGTWRRSGPHRLVIKLSQACRHAAAMRRPYAGGLVDDGVATLRGHKHLHAHQSGPGARRTIPLHPIPRSVCIRCIAAIATGKPGNISYVITRWRTAPLSGTVSPWASSSSR